jgi:glucose/arabinose dehydrogenase
MTKVLLDSSPQLSAALTFCNILARWSRFSRSLIPTSVNNNRCGISGKHIALQVACKTALHNSTRVGRMRGSFIEFLLRLRVQLSAQPSRSRRLAIENLQARTLLAVLPPGFIETPAADNLSRPTAMEFAPNGDLWVLEQDGLVKRFQTGSTAGDVVANISNLGLSSVGERGVLGIAFDLQYSTNKEVYLYYTATSPEIHNRVSRFTVVDTNAADYYFAGADSSGPDAGATGIPTESIIFDLDNLSGATNHNGGAIHFGPDGKLYVAAGENAISANSQSLANALGKILRINADGSIPTDNPFFASATNKGQAIWALGLRNPYTFAFQPGTGRMFINDVGQNTWEEIDDGLAGSNYGWPSIEGNQGTPPTSPGTYVGPLYTYSHGGGTFQGFAITGGAFYPVSPQFPAAQQFPPDYAGDYFFADYVNDWINVLDIATGNVTRFASGASGSVDLRVASDGSLYYLARNDGQVFRVTFPRDEAFPWHNPQNSVDVNADNNVAANDALTIINIINATGSGPLSLPSAGNSIPPFVDVFPDNFVAPNDVLTVINYINANPAIGEGEPSALNQSPVASTTPDLSDLMGLLAADIYNGGDKRRFRSA